MKVWITWYALTSGIQENEAKQDAKNPRLIRLVTPDSLWSPYVWKPHWHETREAAVAHAEKMRKSKLASLRKQIQSVEALKFEETKE